MRDTGVALSISAGPERRLGGCAGGGSTAVTGTAAATATAPRGMANRGGGQRASKRRVPCAGEHRGMGRQGVKVSRAIETSGNFILVANKRVPTPPRPTTAPRTRHTPRPRRSTADGVECRHSRHAHASPVSHGSSGGIAALPPPRPRGQGRQHGTYARPQGFPVPRERQRPRGGQSSAGVRGAAQHDGVHLGGGTWCRRCGGI